MAVTKKRPGGSIIKRTDKDYYTNYTGHVKKMALPANPRFTTAGRSKYPIHKLEVGEYLWVERPEIGWGLNAKAKKLGIKISVRKAMSKGVKGAKLWRVE